MVFFWNLWDWKSQIGCQRKWCEENHPEKNVLDTHSTSQIQMDSIKLQPKMFLNWGLFDKLWNSQNVTINTLRMRDYLKMVWQQQTE